MDWIYFPSVAAKLRIYLVLFLKNYFFLSNDRCGRMYNYSAKMSIPGIGQDCANGENTA